MRSPQPTTLAGGIAVLLLGLWMLGDQAGIVGVSLAAIGPVLLALIGAVLLVSGLARRE